MDFLALAQRCAPSVHPQTMAAVAHVESGFNPFAIGVVGGRLERQPRDREEAVATARSLDRSGTNYSVGLAQVNRANFGRFGLTLESAFDACPNLRAGGEILTECFLRARNSSRDKQDALRAAFSCYYSGNFVTGFRQGYVIKVLGSSRVLPPAMPLVPQIQRRPSNPIGRAPEIRRMAGESQPIRTKAFIAHSGGAATQQSRRDAESALLF